MSTSLDDPAAAAFAGEAWSQPRGGDNPVPDFEQVLSELENAIDDAVRRAGSLVQELRKARSASGSGHVEVLQQSLARVAKETESFNDAVLRLDPGISLDIGTYLAEGRLVAEIAALAAAAGLRVEHVGDRLVCYPSVLKVLADVAAVEIDGRREYGIRPSRALASLEAARDRGSRFRPAPFLDAIEAAYRHLTNLSTGRAPIVRLVDIWSLLTLRPGTSSEYSKAEFARDLNLLDESGVTVTAGGRTIRFSASSGTRTDAALTTVGRDGRPHIYWGVSFS